MYDLSYTLVPCIMYMMYPAPAPKKFVSKPNI